MSNHFDVTCQELITNDNAKYITCFYQYALKNSRFVIGQISFDPDNDFSYINDRKYLETIDGQHVFRYAVSTTNEGNSKAYVCYSSYGQYACCFYFDINKREFSKIFKFGETGCKSNLYSLYLNYNIKKNEFVFSCVNNKGNGYYMSLFEENFNFIRPSV